MGSPWTPQEAGVHQICYLLAEVQKPGTNQGQILNQLEQCKAFPDFNNYLAFIFAQADSLPIEVRQSAGLLLKNNLKDQYAGTTEDFRRYIKLALLHAIGNPSKPLRHTVGTNVAVIVGVGGLPTWPELLSAIVACLESDDPDSLEGALDALYKICEDTPVQLESEVPGAPDRPSSVLVPRLLRLFESPHEDAKCLAVSIMNLLAGGMPHALSANLDRYLQGLFALAHDSSTEVRKAVCTGLVQMLSLEPDRLQPHMHDIIEYMLASTQSGDEGVALESCEFWSAFCEAAVEPGVLRPFLSRLVPVLLRNMVYDDYDEEVSDVEAAEEAALAGTAPTEDRDQDVKPFVHKGQSHGDSESDSDGDEINRWNLRKCSAAGLDILSTVFGDELLPIVIPIVERRLQEADWRARESGILALGAISDGCAHGLIPHLEGMINIMLPKVADARPLVRSISCWALSRYAHWLASRAQQPGSGAAQLDEVLRAILTGVLDRNRHVQEAACSSLATLEEAAGAQLEGRLQAILEALSLASTKYTRKNLRILYDALSTLADAQRGNLAPHLPIFMPPLVARWQALPDTDRELLPLLECFTSLAQALGPAFEPFAVPAFERCERIVTAQLQAQAQAQQQASQRKGGAPPGIHFPDMDRDFVISSLDLVSGLAEGLGPSIHGLLAHSQLRSMVLQCCQDPSSDVRQSAFALVGDLARSCWDQVRPALPALLELARAQLDTAHVTQANMPACNNACWSLGELAIKATAEELAPVAMPVLERLVLIMAAPLGHMPRSIIENSAITLGRLAWMCPEPIAPHLEHFITPWCTALRTVRDDVEKEHAFLGLAALLRMNALGALSGFVPLCEAIASWHIIRCDGLRHELIQLMQLYRNNLAQLNQWDRYLGMLQPAVREKLASMCQL